MKFIREIPLLDNKTNELVQLHNFGFILVWRESSVEVWAAL